MVIMQLSDKAGGRLKNALSEISGSGCFETIYLLWKSADFILMMYCSAIIVGKEDCSIAGVKEGAELLR